MRLPFAVAALLIALPLHAAPPAAPAPAPNVDWCEAIGRRLRSVPPETCRQLKLQTAETASTRGHALRYSDVPPPVRKIARAGEAREPRPLRILLIGGIHGDELTSSAIVFRWLQWLGEDEPSRYHWRVVPVANPDGLLATSPQRTNGHGVDLNRNFPTPDWDKNAHDYWIGRTGSDPRRFPGKTAESEPETRWLRGQIESFRPDLVISVHAPFGLLDYDGPARQPRRFGHLNLNRLGIYPGSLGNYGGVHKNMPVITIELPHATAMPPAKEQREIWQDMLTWIRRNVASRQYS